MVGTGVNYAGTATGMKNIRLVRVNNAGSVLTNNFYNVTDFTNPALTFDSEGMALAEVSSTTGARRRLCSRWRLTRHQPHRCQLPRPPHRTVHCSRCPYHRIPRRTRRRRRGYPTSYAPSFIPNRFFICGNTTNPNGITRPFVVRHHRRRYQLGLHIQRIPLFRSSHPKYHRIQTRRRPQYRQPLRSR
jgi:hypothetical protein